MTPALFDDLYNPRPDPEPLWAPVARNSDPPTSHEAAHYAALNAGTLRARALRELVACGPQGATDFELADRCRSQQTSIGKRRGELVAMGYVEATGETRSAPSGAQATVWRATARGREAV